MPSRKLLRAFVALWWTVGLLLLLASLQTLHAALGPKAQLPLVLLAAVEGASALLFLVPRTLRLGAAGLLVTLATAFVAHLVLHQLRWDLLLDGAAVAFVAMHGTPSGAQWKQAVASA